MKSLVLLLLLASFVISSCATTGPQVSKEEIEKAKEDLEIKAWRYKFNQMFKVDTVGFRLLTALLKEKKKKEDYPYLGFRTVDLTPKMIKVFGFSVSKAEGPVVINSTEGGPIQRAGIKKGDIITKFGDKEIKQVRDLASVFQKLKPDEEVKVAYIREGQKETTPVKVGGSPLNVSFDVVDSEEINAGATPNKVLVTYGMMRFLKSDDELAVIMGHELAHIVRGHHAKGAATDFLSALLGVTLGVLAEASVSGSGNLIMREASAAFSAKFSREFEREADYFGLLYVYKAGYDIEAGINIWERFSIEVPQSMIRHYFNTHPTSPERMVRIRKIIEELKAGKGGEP